MENVGFELQTLGLGHVTGEHRVAVFGTGLCTIPHSADCTSIPLPLGFCEGRSPARYRPIACVFGRMPVRIITMACF